MARTEKPAAPVGGRRPRSAATRPHRRVARASMEWRGRRSRRPTTRRPLCGVCARLSTSPARAAGTASLARTRRPRPTRGATS